MTHDAVNHKGKRARSRFRVKRTVQLDEAVLDRLRIAANLLRCELANKAGIGQSTIVKVFAGRPVMLTIARRIARALKVRLDDLLVRELAEATAEAGA